jgi:hypothetical protein
MAIRPIKPITPMMLGPLIPLAYAPEAAVTQQGAAPSAGGPAVRGARLVTSARFPRPWTLNRPCLARRFPLTPPLDLCSFHLQAHVHVPT